MPVVHKRTNSITGRGPNPIRKVRTVRIPGPRPDDPDDIPTVHVGYWYAVCPDCGQVVREWRSYSRKKAKDVLHKHRVKEHAGPGGSST